MIWSQHTQWRGVVCHIKHRRMCGHALQRTCFGAINYQMAVQVGMEGLGQAACWVLQ